MIEWIQAYLIYGVFLPALLLCMIPMRNYLKWKISFVKFMTLTMIGIFLWISGLYYLQITGVLPNHFITPVTIFACAIFYGVSFRIQKSVLIYVFSLIFCLFSFAILLSYMGDAYQNPAGTSRIITLEASLFHWIPTLLVSSLFIAVYWQKLAWLIEYYRKTRIWLYTSMPPFIITFCNLMLIPRKFSNLYIGRAFPVLIIIVITLLILFFLIQINFYTLARISCDQATAEQTHQLIRMQLHQQEIQHNYIMETHRLRHDFKHSVMALSALLQDHKYQEAQDYLKEFYNLQNMEQSYTEFCRLPALNALLNEYMQKAGPLSIRFHHRINLPENLNIPEPQLCILIGNLLDNAFHACEKIPEDKRYIRLLFDTEGQTQLYLLVQNSFDGKITWKDGLPGLIPRDHYGISSVQAIADKYRGVARFHTDETNFSAEVMLSLEK